MTSERSRENRVKLGGRHCQFGHRRRQAIDFHCDNLNRVLRVVDQTRQNGRRGRRGACRHESAR